MPKVTIDNQTIEVPEGTTILQAARMIGGDGRNLEVLTIYGWRRPAECWAIGPDVAVKVQVENEHQLGLFGK